MQELVGQVVLGEHRLERLVRSDGSLSLFESVSTVDQGTYAVMVAHEVRVETAATAIEAAVDRAGRHAVGVKGLVSLLRGTTLATDERTRLAVVRRGAPSDDPLPARASIADAVRMLEPLAEALAILHEQGLVHGAICPLTLGQRNGALVLDFFGLGAAAEAASGARGSRDLLAPAYRPPELRGERPATPGPWTDIAALATVALELITGQRNLLADSPEPPPLEAFGLIVSPQVTDLFARTLSSTPRQRPLDARAFLRELLAGASAPIRPAEARVSAPVAPLPSQHTPAPPPAEPTAPAPPLPPPPGPPDLEAMHEARHRRLLFMLVGTGLALMLGGMGLAAIYVFQGPGGLFLPIASGSIPLPPAPPSAAASSSSAAGLPPGPTMPLAPAHGAAIYPADATTLLPVTADGAVWGDRDALATLILFGDLTCPFTARALASLPTLATRFGTELRIAFKHYPLPGSKEARQAAEAAAIAWDTGKSDSFWRFVSAATRQGGQFDDGRLEELGIKSGLPAGAITDGLTRHSQRLLIDRDIELGRRLGIRGTPVLFVNGRRMDGLNAPEKIARLIDFEIKRARDTLTKGTPRDALYARQVTTNVTTSKGEEPIPDR